VKEIENLIESKDATSRDKNERLNTDEFNGQFSAEDKVLDLNISKREHLSRSPISKTKKST